MFWCAFCGIMNEKKAEYLQRILTKKGKDKSFSQKGLDFTVNCNVIMVQKEVVQC